MFYDVFCGLCAAKGVSPTRAAIEIGLSNSAPTMWKKRKATPPVDILNKVSEYFGVTLDELLSDESEKSPAVSVDPTTAELLSMVNNMNDEQRARALAMLIAAFGEK